MPVIAVVNGKGGSGKSTVATHLAAWCAREGKAVMLGDVDRQQSTRIWLRRRSAELPTISSWASTQTNTLRVPNGVTHVILDTPGGMHGFDLARVVMFADAIIMPIGNSIFDREAAATCQAELLTLPRVASGRCRLASIGMRINSRPQSTQVIKDWAQTQKLPFLGILRENNMYVRCLEHGMTLFDLPPEQVKADLIQWQPILQWLQPVLQPAPAPGLRTAVPGAATATRAPGLHTAAPSAVRPAGAQATPAAGQLASVLKVRPSPLPPANADAHAPEHADGLTQIPAFLRHAG